MIITKQQINSEYFSSARIFFKYKERKFVIHNAYDYDDFRNLVVLSEINGNFQTDNYGDIMDFCQMKKGLAYKDWDIKLFKDELKRYDFLNKLENLC